MNIKSVSDLNFIYLSIVTGSDEKALKRVKRFGSGLNAAFSSFRFFCEAHGKTWETKEQRKDLEEVWNEFREDNQSEVNDTTGYHFIAATERKTYSDTRGELTSHKRFSFKKTLNQRETAEYLEDRSKFIRNEISGKLEKVKQEVGAELQEAAAS